MTIVIGVNLNLALTLSYFKKFRSSLRPFHLGNPVDYNFT